MSVIINIYKTAAHLDAYSKSGVLDDPIWPRSSFTWDGEVGQVRDIQVYARNDGTSTAYSVVAEVVDVSGPDESTWSKLATSQAALDGAAPGNSLALGDLASGGTISFWMRVTVPGDTEPEDKTDLRLRTTASWSSSSSSSSTSSSSSSNSSSSQSSISSHSSGSSSSSESSSSSSGTGYFCDGWLLAVAHWPDNNVYIYDGIGTLNLIDTVETPGEYPDAVTMLDGDLIVADSENQMIYILVGTTSAIRTSFTTPGIPTGLCVIGGNLIHSEVGNYPVGTIYLHDGITSTIISSFDTPSEMANALAAADGDLISTDNWDKRIYFHSGLSKTITSYYDCYRLNIEPCFPDVRGLAYDPCGNLLEYDTRAKRLYVHSGLSSSIQAQINYNMEFTGIGTPQTGCPAPDTYGLNRGGYNLMTSGGIQEQALSSSSSSSSST